MTPIVSITVKLTPAEYALVMECLDDAVAYGESRIRESIALYQTGIAAADRLPNVKFRQATRTRVETVQALRKKLA
jgi:hypothetical protein